MARRFLLMLSRLWLAVVIVASVICSIAKAETWSLPQLADSSFNGVFKDVLNVFQVKGLDGARYSTEFAPTPSPHLEGILKSSIRIGVCSGTLISNEGHVLFALHCLKDLISSGTYVDKTLLLSRSSFSNHGQAKLFDINNRDFSFKYEFSIQNKVYITFDQPGIPFEVVYTGKAMAMSFPKWDKANQTFNMNPETLKVWQNNLEDFAIVKINLDNIRREVKCAQIRQSPLTSKDKVVVVGYPYNFSSDNYRYNVSFIPVVEDGKLNPQGVPDYTSQFLELFPVQSTYVTQAFVSDGMSGGGLFDNSGRLVGVNTVAIGYTNGKGFKPYVVSYKISYILKRFLEDNSAKFANEVFNCPN